MAMVAFFANDFYDFYKKLCCFCCHTQEDKNQEKDKYYATEDIQPAALASFEKERATALPGHT